MGGRELGNFTPGRPAQKTMGFQTKTDFRLRREPATQVGKRGENKMGISRRQRKANPAGDSLSKHQQGPRDRAPLRIGARKAEVEETCNECGFSKKTSRSFPDKQKNRQSQRIRAKIAGQVSSRARVGRSQN